MPFSLLMIAGGTVLLLLCLGLAWRLLADPPLEGDAWALSIFLILFSITLGYVVFRQVLDVVSYTIPRREVFDLITLAPFPLGLAVFMGWNFWAGIKKGEINQRSHAGIRYVTRRSSQPISYWSTLMFLGAVSLLGIAAFLFVVFALVGQA